MSESKMEDIVGMDDCVEDIGMDNWLEYEGDTMVIWNLDDYPIPAGARFRSIRFNITKALVLMGFGGSMEIWAYADHLKYERIDALFKGGIRISEDSAVYKMPRDMIVYASPLPPERLAFLVIANQRPGSELHRIQQCLKSRNYSVYVVDDPSKQCLFHSAESLVDCIHFFGEGTSKMTSPKPIIERAYFFRSDKPISEARYKEIESQCRDIYGPGYSSAFEDYVSRLCKTIANCQKLCLEDIIARIQFIRPMPEEFYCLIHELLRERGFSLNLPVERDTTKISPFKRMESLSHVESTQALDEGKPISNLISKTEIQDFSEPITHVDTVVFWDVVGCPFPLSSNPDEIYHRIYKALHKKGEMTIWAYVDENNGPWSGEYLHDKTWGSRIYFLPGGDDRRCRMLNDCRLWQMDMHSAAYYSQYPAPADVIVISDQVRGDEHFLRMLGYMTTYSFKVYLVTPTQHVNNPESQKWPELLLDGAECIGSRPVPALEQVTHWV